MSVCITNLNGYYKDLLKILKLSIDSLCNSISNQTAITLINNGACIEVFKNLQKAGVVGIVPEFKQYENLGYYKIYNNRLNSNRNFTTVKNSEDLKKNIEV